MTFLYRTQSWNSTSQHPDQEIINLWKHISDKANWRIVQLPNGFYQTEYRDIKEQKLPLMDQLSIMLRN